MSALADWLVRRSAVEWAGHGARPLTPAQRRALAALARCRTPALGGHVYRCGACDEADFSYHSCHHRACPRCGGAGAAEWTARQVARLLPVPYFFVTCTVPEEVRPVFAARPEVVHDLFFTTAARALQTVAANPRHLGAELGLIGVLHTWGRQLQHHPHLHFIVPGGGLAPDGTWRAAKRSDWLLPLDAVAAAVRAGMDEALRHAAPDLHAQVPARVWREGWWVHGQPAGTGKNVVQYLARYVRRTAITDERILAADDERVTFRYTDTATQARKECTLDAGEFMRRYLQHVPPPGQHRVRYFGWLHPAAKARRLRVETLLAVVIVVKEKMPEPPPWHLRCRHCGEFALVRIGSLARAPPVCAGKERRR